MHRLSSDKTPRRLSESFPVVPLWLEYGPYGDLTCPLSKTHLAQRPRFPKSGAFASQSAAPLTACHRPRHHSTMLIYKIFRSDECRPCAATALSAVPNVHVLPNYGYGAISRLLRQPLENCSKHFAARRSCFSLPWKTEPPLACPLNGGAPLAVAEFPA